MDIEDEYSHINSGIIYFPQSIPTKEIECSITTTTDFCECTNTCKESDCPCLQKSGTYYECKDINDIQNYCIRERNIKMPTYECNSNCNCYKFCGNKLVQFGPRKNLTVKTCTDFRKGVGLFTNEDIQANTFVCEYAGEIISEEEATRRFENNRDRINYIFCINEYFGERNVKTYIDPTCYGNIGRYINHSCEPNCNLVIVRIETNIPILGIFAKEYVPKNTELTYDYGSEDQENESNKLKPCYCGAKTCKRYLPCNLNV